MAGCVGHRTRRRIPILYCALDTFQSSLRQMGFVFSGCCSSAEKSLLCQKQNDPEVDPSSVAQLYVSLINDKCPSVRVAFLLDNSLTLNRSPASADSKNRSSMP